MSKNDSNQAAPEVADALAHSIALINSVATISLETPIVRGDQTITSLSFRKPKAGELRGVALSDLLRLDVSALQTVLPRITNPILTPADVAGMDLPDLLAAGGAVVGFFMTAAERASQTA